MDDELFDARYAEWNNRYCNGLSCDFASFLCSNELTSLQFAVVLTNNISKFSYTEMAELAKHKNFGHAEFLLVMLYGGVFDIMMMFSHSLVRTTEEIEFGLSHDDEIVRMYASRHPCCTDEQKVKHHLKYGFPE